MKKLTSCFFLTIIVSTAAYSQQAIVKGSVIDSSEKKMLANSVIALLRKSDSVLIAFARTDKDGNFLLKNAPVGKSILLVTQPTYGDYVDEINVPATESFDLGKIFLTLKSQLLQEVIVSNAGAIRVKGDTTEYKVDSFHLQAGASVEDMLKKLPGIQVDKNGKITAQGETVQKVLVDGEEFFSDDPTIVTRNILSDAIDKVQVYDKKSDQAAFTGIDDGQKTKTIDLKMKENRKKGYFGKVDLGTDGNRYWNNSAMVNAFKGKRKISAFGIMSNTGKTGLDWNERTNYGGSGNMEMGFEDGGMYMTSSGGNDEFDRGSFYGEGLPKGWNGGLLYSNKWNDKLSANTSYQFKKLNTEARGSTQSKYILPDTLYYVNDNGNSYSSKYRNTLNGTYEYQIDSSATLKVTALAYTGQSNTINNSYSESLDKFGNFVNTSNRSTNYDAEEKRVNTTLLYRKKFKKPGRTVSLNMSQNYNENLSGGFLDAEYKYFDDNGSVKQQQRTDQQKINDNIRSTVDGRVVYTEPLSKRAILEFNYGVSNSHGSSSISTLEQSAASGGKYSELIDSLSNNYSLNVLTNAAGINYRYAKPKRFNFSFGGNVSRADFQRVDRKTDTAVNYNFFNLFPRASLNYTLPRGGNVYFNYFGNTQAPSIDQIQPVKDNTNELNQKIGNPDLKQSFSQRFSVSYNNYKLLSQRSIYTSINYSVVQNAFSTINFVDDLGRRISQPVNVSGNYNMSAYLYYGKRLKKPAAWVGLDANVSQNHNTNFINTLKNINDSYNFSAGPRMSFNKEKKYDITFAPRAGWTKSTTSIRPDEPTQYWTQDHYVDVVLFLPLKFEFRTDVTFSLREKTDAFDRNTNATRWNARIDKKFLKKNAGILRLSAFDILNQNIGFQRTVNSNFITERTYDTFRRYFMLSFIYNFSKNGTPQQY